MCKIGDFVEMLDVPEAKPIRAYRAWYGTRKNPLSLCSWAGDAGGWKAKGKSKAIGIPREDNNYGFWAYKNKATFSVHNWLEHSFAGTVLLWGKVAKYTLGYRAQFASIPAKRVAARKKAKPSR